MDIIAEEVHRHSYLLPAITETFLGRGRELFIRVISNGSFTIAFDHLQIQRISANESSLYLELVGTKYILLMS